MSLVLLCRVKIVKSEPLDEDKVGKFAGEHKLMKGSI